MPRFRVLQVYDSIAQAIVYMDHTHHKVHEQKYFAQCDEVQDIASGNHQYYLIKPDAPLHLHYAISSSGAIISRLYENPNTSLDGTGLIPRNLNRAFGTDDPATIIYKSPTVVDPGTILCAELSGGTGVGNTQQSAVGGMGVIEWILSASDTYLIDVESKGTDVDIVSSIAYYRK